jgi:hypothetical protein
MSEHEEQEPLSPHFLQVFQQLAEDKGLKIVRWLEDGAALQTPDAKETSVFFGNLYRRCRETPPDDWPEIIDPFLNQVLVKTDLPTNLAEVADQILVRLGPPFRHGPAAARPWSLPLGDSGLEIHLVIDYPERMLYVTPDLVEQSGRPAQEWVDLGCQHLQERTAADWFRLLDPDSGMKAACVGDSYDAARALVLDALLPDTAKEGCWVLPLARDRLFFLPVSMKVVHHVHLLKMLADDHFTGIPYPISDQVYWVHGRTWMHFPIEISDNKVMVFPPTEMMDTLGWVNQLRVRWGEDPNQGGTEETRF